MRRLACFVMSAAVFAAGCSADTGSHETDNGSNSGIKYEYGVFLGAEPESLPDMMPYRTIVLDAQYFTREQISELKDTGHTVYSYINIGAVEDFRPYYERFEPLTLGGYEHWDEERWVDVSRPEWQSFVLDELAPALLAKGADGFFADNCDVYYNFTREDIFGGTAALLGGLKALGAYVSVNGGDAFVTEYADRYGTLDGVLDAVNQETVFSKIDWDSGTFSANPDSEREYFIEYTDRAASLGRDVYLLEYTSDERLIERIAEHCEERGYRWYAADSLELPVPSDGRGSQPLFSALKN